MTILDERFESFHGRKYNDGVMDFMFDLKNAGFTEEFDNSLVMRMLWEKVDALNAVVKNKLGALASTLFTMEMEVKPNPVHGSDLIITLRNEHAYATEQLVLFVRDQRLTVSSNVITEEFKPKESDIPVAGTSVYWFEAEMRFKAQKRFDKKAFAAFKAVYKALAPKGSDTACRLWITPTQSGWQVQYKVEGEKVLTMHYTFSD